MKRLIVVLAALLVGALGLGASSAAADPTVSGQFSTTAPLVIEPTGGSGSVDRNMFEGVVAHIARMPVTKTVSSVTIGDLGRPTGCSTATSWYLSVQEHDNAGDTRFWGSATRQLTSSTTDAPIPASPGRVTWSIPTSTFKAGKGYSFKVFFGSGCTSALKQVTWAHTGAQVMGGDATCSDGPRSTARSGADSVQYRMWHEQGVDDRNNDCAANPGSQAWRYSPSMPTGWLVTFYVGSLSVNSLTSQPTQPPDSACGTVESDAGAEIRFWRATPGSPGYSDYVCVWPQYTAPGDVPEFGWFYGAPWTPDVPRDAYLALGTAPAGPSASELNGLGNAATPNLQRCYAGDPVNCATGNFTEPFQDLMVGGRGVGLDLTRTFNSQAAAQTGPFGYGWSFTFGERLSTGAGGVVTVTHGDGSTASFSPRGGGDYAAAGWVQSVLKQRTDGTFAYTLPDQRVYSFTAAGRLEWVEDRNANRTTLSYSGGDLTEVTDPSGRSLELEHNLDGTISTITDPAGEEVSYSYDDGELATVTDVGGGETSFAYDGAHRITSVTDARGKTMSNTYDGQGRVIEQTDPLNHDTSWDYSTPGETEITDPAGRASVHRFTNNLPTSVTRGEGSPVEATTEYDYDPDGNPVLITDPDSQEWASTYDQRGNRTSTSDPLNRTTEYEYDTDRNLTRLTAPSGRETELSYDAAGNLTAVERTHTESSQIQRTEFDYDADGQLTEVTDPLNRTTTFDYNAQGDRTETTTPEGHTASATYDLDSRQATVTTARGHAPGADPADFTTTYTRDAFGNPTDIEDALGEHTLLEYDENQNLVSITDRDGHETITSYDNADQPISVQRADGAILETAYDPTGRISTKTDGLDNDTTYTYDAQGRTASVTDPLDRTTGYSYTDTGNLSVITDALNRTTTNSYDDAGQLTGITHSSGDPGPVTIGYTLDGDRDTVTDDTGATDYDYDSLGRLTGHTNGAGQHTGYGYDLADQLVQLDYPDALTDADSSTSTPHTTVSTGTVTRDYDDDGNLASVADWLSNETTFDYDPDGLLTGIDRPNGTSTSYEHDANGALTDLTDQGDSTGLGRTHEALLSSSTPPVGGATNYSYDDAQRLTGAGTASFDYDDADNLTELTIGGQTITQAFDDANQLTATSIASTPTGSFTYDDLGQRTGHTQGADQTDLTYDQAGQLTSYDGPNHAASGSVTETYTYGADGLRQSKTTGTVTREHAYDLASQGLPTLITDGPTSYITGPDGLPIEQILQDGTARYFHHDQLGSTTELTSQTGTSVATYQYDAYGNPVGTPPATENPFGYAGQYTDPATGLQYLRARYYDPATGQFLTRDPLEDATGQPYAYANNNPTNYTDPSGLIFGIPGTPSLSDIGMTVSNAAAGALDEASFGISTKIAGSIVGFDADCAEWGAGYGSGAALGMVFGFGKFRAAGKLAAKGTGIVLARDRNQLLSAAQDPQLRDAINQLYRRDARVGNGSAMDAYRFEQRTGTLLSPKGHGTKLFERRTQLQRMFRSLGPGDRGIARRILSDIQDAVGGS